MTKHLASKTNARGYLLRGFVFVMALVAASFQAASSESLQMMEVSDRLPSTQPSPTREASANVTSNSTPSISEQAANLIANTLQQPTLTQVPNPTSTLDASAQQTQTTNVRSNAVAAANASAARDEAFFAAALKQPLLTQIPSPQPATSAKSNAPQSAPIAAAPTRDQAFFDAALKQPDLSPYATAADNSQASQLPRVVAKSSAVSSATSVRSEAITDAGLRQPAMNPPSYSVPVAESHAAQPPVAATTAPAPATVAAAPIRSDATSTANLQQPDLSQPTFAPSAIQPPIAQVQPIVTKSAAPQVIAAAPVRADASAVADLKQPEMNRAMPLSPVAESRAVPVPGPQATLAQPTQVAESRVQPMPTPDTKTIPTAPAAAVAIAPPTVAAPGPVRSEPVAVAAPKQSPAVVEAVPQQRLLSEASSAKVASAGTKASIPDRVDAVAVAQLKQPEMNQPVLSPAPVKTADLAQPAQPIRGQYAFDTTAAHSPTAADENAGGATKPMTDAPAPAPAAAPIAGGCQYGCAYGPCQSGAHNICGVECGNCGAPCCATWKDARCIPWSFFGPGEYVGPARTEHVSTYYLRVNDLLRVTYIASRVKASEHYRMGVGDRLRIEWLRMESSKDPSLDRDIVIQPDGNVVLPLVGQVPAAGRTVEDFRDDVTKLYSRYQKEPQITVTPTEVNTGLQDILRAVTSVSGSNGQSQDLRVTPEGTIQAPGLGSIFVQGLTLEELRTELEARYAATFGPGLLVSPALTERATSYVFVGGEVKTPGRFTLEGPTTVMQAIALAGGWNVGGNTRQVVVFRRDENWCLKATKINLHAPLYGQDPCPVNDTWLRDNDLVLVPKERILCADDVINLYFTRGAYAVFPITFFKDFSSGSAITAVP